MQIRRAVSAPISIAHPVFDALVRVGTGDANGELIAAGHGVEAHFYFYGGRLVWAASPRTSSAFIEHLQSRGIERSSVVHVIEDCRRTKRSPMTTLVEWAIATREDVLEAQLVQICEALDEVVAQRDLATLFIPKELSYAADLSHTIAGVAAASARRFPAVHAELVEVLSSSATSRDSDSSEGRALATVRVCLPELMNIDGCLGACFVDSCSGVVLAGEGGGEIDLELAAMGYTELIRAKRKTLDALRLDETVEDILITLGRQYHVLRPLSCDPRIFICIILDKSTCNLAMARHQLRFVESDVNL